MKKFLSAFFLFFAISNMVCAQSLDVNKALPMDKTNPNFSKCGKGIYSDSKTFYNFYVASTVSREFLFKCPMTSSEDFDVGVYKLKTQGSTFEVQDGFSNCYSKAVAEDMKLRVSGLISRQNDFCNNNNVMQELGKWMRYADKAYNPIR